MLNIDNKTKVYVACPYGTITGGTESLHQLVFELNKINVDAYIYYYNAGRDLKVNEKFKKYTDKVAYEVNDESSNIIVIPEVATQLLYKYRNIRKCIWWLSLDFYFKSMPSEMAKNNKIVYKVKNKNLSIVIRPIIEFIYKIKNKKFNILNFEKDKNIHDYIHLYNCEYVKDFLIAKGIKESNTHYLCGPISNEYISDINISKNKYNIVAYNPSKESKFYKVFIDYIYTKRNDILFFPIQNMNQKQVKILLRKSKVYMDFGFFPGPERIPREAVVSYCNILTSNRGSANNNKDVLVPRKYKYDIVNDDIDKIYKGLEELIDKYEENLELYNPYRKKVYDQMVKFNIDISDIFKIYENKEEV